MAWALPPQCERLRNTLRISTASRNIIPLGSPSGPRYFDYDMGVLSFYVAIFVLLLCASATALCFAYFDTFRHRSAFWLSLCMLGISFFALAGLLFGLSSSAPQSAAYLGPIGLRLLWQGLGAVLIVHSLPRFLLCAFGGTHRPLLYRLLDVATGFAILLSTVRIATGWNDLAAAAALPNAVLRIFLDTFIGASFLCTLVFQSHLPDRSLYKTVLAQIGASTVLLPLVILEDVGLLRIPAFPYLSGQIFFAATTAFAILHAHKSLRRPKYARGGVPSSYFVEHFGVSERELEVVTGVMNGQSNNEIAEMLFISPRTVEKHLYNVYQKAGIKSRLQLFNLLRSDAE